MNETKSFDDEFKIFEFRELSTMQRRDETKTLLARICKEVILDA